MNEKDKIYTKKYQVHYYELNFLGKAHLLALLNYLQDAAGEHATMKGLYGPELVKKNLTWLLSRYHIKVLRYPALGETIEVLTWPSAKQEIFTLRDFEIKDSKGNCLLVATTSWILLNLEKKQPARLDDVLPESFILARRALEDDFPSLVQLEKSEKELVFPVLIRDLDINRHVNNTVYIQWALETVPEDILNSKQPIEIEVSFRAEAFYGDCVVSRIQRLKGEKNATFLHQIINQKNGAELSRLKTIWG